MDYYNTLSIEHNRKLKKFQWRKSYSLRDFKALLTQVFSVNGEILGLKDRTGFAVFSTFIKKILGNVYDLDYFCKYPQELKPQVYYLLLEQSATLEKRVSNRPWTQSNDSDMLKSEFLFFLDSLVDQKQLLGNKLSLF